MVVDRNVVSSQDLDGTVGHVVRAEESRQVRPQVGRVGCQRIVYVPDTRACAILCDMAKKLLNNGAKKKDAAASDDAGTDASKEPPADGVRPEGTRRRRGPRPPQEISEELKQYYIDVANFRHFNEQGLCGCGAIH